MEKRRLLPKLTDSDLDVELTGFISLSHWRFFAVGCGDIYLVGHYGVETEVRVHMSTPIVGIREIFSCALSRTGCGYYLGDISEYDDEVQYVWDMLALHHNFKSVRDLTREVENMLTEHRRSMSMTEQELDLILPF